MSRVSLSEKHARAVRDELEVHFFGLDATARAALEVLRSALAPSTKSTRARSAARKEKTARRAEKSVETGTIRDAVAVRADGRCECCGRAFTEVDPMEMDHAFGRAKVRQSVANCWALRRSCHRLKTLNRPSREWWLRVFADHAWGHCYSREAKRAEAELASIADIAEAAALTGGGR